MYIELEPHEVVSELQDYMIPVNETTESLELHLELNTASNMYWMLISTFEIAIDTNRKNGMGRVCLLLS